MLPLPMLVLPMLPLPRLVSPTFPLPMLLLPTLPLPKLESPMLALPMFAPPWLAKPRFSDDGPPRKPDRSLPVLRTPETTAGTATSSRLSLNTPETVLPEFTTPDSSAPVL
ncbi:hypothetical protein LAUMK7_03555 [Mycobacterium kansasii]|nr:hypothetical protein LAUMK22_02958 [Mycobacterium kansasii]VAZ67456.1 hypothetical protein LAUMK40_03595 [Mycobacterium kansasii]VAZ76856.1 hypothetical protein LAUMK7_03555 [Mycobacterium kansasii]